MARDYPFSVVNPENPTGPQVQGKIPGEVYLRQYKDNYVKYLNLKAAQEVLERPMLIFGGVRVFQEGGWCFIGEPSQVNIRENVTAPLAPDLVFAVYLNPFMSVYEWRAELREALGSLFPKDWKERYVKGLVWKRTS